MMNARQLVPEQDDQARPEDGALQAVLETDWRRLYPLRETHGDRIRGLLQQRHRGHVNARVAFGALEAEHGSSWLYRDFYVESAPSAASVDRAIGKLRRGDPRELTEILVDGGHPEHSLRRMWYEVSTLAGRVVGDVLVQRGSAVQHGVLEVLPVAAAEPVSVVNEAEIARGLVAALSAPIGVEAHRQNLNRSLSRLLSDSLRGAHADHTVSLLMHHMDLKPRGLVPWSSLSPALAAAWRRAMSAISDKISTPPRFLSLLTEGLSSPSRERRFLSYRLLRLDGHLGAGSHPDDLAPDLR